VYLDSAVTALVTGTAYELTYTAGTIADSQALVYDTTTGANKVKFGGTSAANAKATIVAVQGINTTTVKVFLSEAIDTATSAETVAATYAVYAIGTTTVAGTVTTAVYSADDNSVTLTLGAALNPAVIYDLRVIGSMKDMNQQAMDITVSYNFTVGQ
ncbi:MAG: Ig-like domain-containing protein, partial [Lutisporaceae bacterium]